MCGCGPNPAGGFAAIAVRCSPALNQTALPIYTTEYFPLARTREQFQVHEIEFQDWFPVGNRRFYSEKPLSNWTGHSRGIQLYGT